MRTTLLRSLPALLLLAVGLAASPAAADPKKAPANALTFSTERAFVFKDGYGLIVKRGEGLADAQGRLVTSEVPAGAVLGTFWAAVPEGAPRLRSLTAEWVEETAVVEDEVPATSVGDLLKANLGRAVTLGLAREGTPSLEATVVELLAESKPLAAPWGEAAAEPEASSRPVYGYGGAARQPFDPRPGFVVLEPSPKGSGERLVLAIGEIRTVRGAGLVTRRARTETFTRKVKRLTADLGPEGAGKAATVRLLYLTSGLRWIPAYRLSGALVSDGTLALQGEVLNDAEDLAGAELGLVVGVPNFTFKDQPSPLSLEAAVRSLAGRGDSRTMSQLVSNSALREPQDPLQPGFAAAPGLSATGEQDLFVYDVGRVSLPRGARMALPLWASSVPLQHLYTYDVSASAQAREAREQRERRNPSDRVGHNEVWHQLELTNGQDVPWTTGPVLVLRGDLPVGQELLTYTSRGAAALLPVTVAVDVRGTYREEELAREPNALVWRRETWARVTKKAVVSLTNHRAEPSRVRVRLSTVGLVRSAAREGVVRSLPSEDVNTRGEVTWSLTLAPGESVALEAEYQTFIP